MPEKEQPLQEIGYIKNREITEEIKESYLDYAMSVIVSRALPDVRDGLKPVHRRILYAMYEDGLRHNAKFRKSATVVGSTLGRYHPHGDIAVYDSLVRMAQDFSLRYPLVKGQGNFGSIDSDQPAAQRYTECKLSAIGEEMLQDIEKDTVNFIPNYDATRKEPSVLPSPLPQLLLNGSLGIAVGMATNIPPHNASEVLQAAVFLLENPQAATEDLMEFVKGPDFPTGGIIYNKRDIIAAYSQGKGPILMRGKAEIQETKKGASQIVISEIPFQVVKSSLVLQIAKVVEDKKIDGIRDVRDESDREGIRVVVELKKEAFPKKVLNVLYKYTDLQKTFHLNMLALVDGIQPRVLSLVDVLAYYLKHKQDVVVRRTKYDLQKAKERSHILEGLMTALKNIDEVIKIIKRSASREDARQNLQKTFKFSEAQANSILEMRLSQLAKLERDKIEQELLEIQKTIKELNAILQSPAKLKETVKKELLGVEAKFKDERRTKLVAGKLGEFGDEDLIPQEEAMIMVSSGGLIKRMKPSAYKIQKRGGKGVVGMETAEEDIVEHFLKADTLDKLMFFTDSGKMFQCFVWEIPELTRQSKGRGLLNFIDISSQDKILSLLSYDKKTEESADNYLVLATKDGVIKKTLLAAFKNVRRNGLLAIKLQPGDSLKSAKIAKAGDEISLITKNGKSIRFKESDVRNMGRGAGGVHGMRLDKGDEIIAMDIIKLKVKSEKLKIGEKIAKDYLLIITENGFGKRTPVEEFRLQHRGGAGIKAANISEKTGKIVFAKILEQNEEDLIVISKKGQVIRSALKSVPIHGRAASGVHIMRLQSGDKVASGLCLMCDKIEEAEVKDKK
ncbi:MAG: DNA gyrase subunit A [Patescibacteria group bacterium]|nr:DNA gyrase subunit A [Patescibacteria group bacterium]